MSERGRIDPIIAEIIRHQLLSIPEQIDVNITRTAYSPLVYEYKDYAVGITDPEGRLVAQSDGGIPIFFANALGVAVRDGLAVHGPDGIAEGDVLFSNHAATLGQHLNNVVMYTPLFVDGTLVAFMCVLVHWIDVGGIVVGSCISHATTEIFQEGVQFRSVRLWRRGEPVADIYRMIEINTRFPRQLLGDIAAQLAGCLRGRDLLAGLYARHGAATMRAAIEALWDRSEQATRRAISRIPDGSYEAESFLDNDGVDLATRVPIRVVVRIAGETMEVDFSGIADQLRGPLNSGRQGGAETAARIALKYLAAPHEPANDGSFRPLTVTIPEGKFLNARPGAPMGCYSMPLPTVIDTILKAMVPAAPEHLAGGHYATFGGHTFYGRQPAREDDQAGELWQLLGATAGGWGASAGHDGPGPYKTMSHGDTQDVPAEVQESLYPLRVEHARLRPDSGGAGQWRGGLGLERLYTVLAPTTARTSIDRNSCPPWGILGGGDGAPNRTSIEPHDAAPRELLKGFSELRPGDQARVQTGGGGGYGDPFARDPALVVEDVAEGLVSIDQARDLYGVAFAPDRDTIEHDATERDGSGLHLAGGNAITVIKKTAVDHAATRRLRAAAMGRSA
jgi:N-methylhydantoinase B